MIIEDDVITVLDLINGPNKNAGWEAAMME